MKHFSKKIKNLKKIIGLSLLASPLFSLAFVPSVSQYKQNKVDYEKNSLVKVVNDKSFLNDKPVIYQFESDGINFYPNTLPLKYENINWDLPLKKLVNGLDSFDGKKFFKDYSLTLIKEFDYFPYSQNHTFVNVLNDINYLKSQANEEIEKANFYIEIYKEKKDKMSMFLDKFKKDDSNELDFDKMSIAKIKNFVAFKFDVSSSDLDALTYNELVKSCDAESNQAKIKEMDEAIKACEVYKEKYESKLVTLKDMTKELTTSFNKFVEEWKEKNSWYKNYDTEKEMKKELKNDYEKNKMNNFLPHLEVDDLFLEINDLISSISNFFDLLKIEE